MRHAARGKRHAPDLSESQSVLEESVREAGGTGLKAQGAEHKAQSMRQAARGAQD